MDKRCDTTGDRTAAGRAAALTLALALGLAACDSVLLAPFVPDAEFREVAVDDPRAPRPPVEIALNLPTLAEASSLVTARIAPEAGLHERRRDWRSGEPSGVAAGVVVRRRLDGGAIDVPADVREALALWPDLAIKAADFEPLYQSRNGLGEVFWRRFVSGGRICVLFQQGAGADPDAPTRRIAGHYCAATGDSLTPGQAETVVQALQVVDAPG